MGGQPGSPTVSGGPCTRAAVAVMCALAVLASSVLTASAAPPAPPVLVGAGDIADCSYDSDEQTARLIDSIPGTVFTTGDNVYSDGTPQEYAECYHPTWGRHRARTKPSPGNHERDGDGYIGYFGSILPTDHPFWYSYDLGSWHIISLDSYCGHRVACGPNTPQMQWLRADLAAAGNACIAAYWHHPRFSSGDHASDEDMAPFWDALYEAGADVVINGHSHSYERFAPQDPDANADPDGIRQFVVGTGGASLRGVKSPIANSEVQYRADHGVLKLTLHDGSYDWEFITVDGGYTDKGSSVCSGATPTPPPTYERIKVRLDPVADATLNRAQPDRARGRARVLSTGTDPQARALVRFDASGLDGTPVAASLRMWVVDGSRNGPSVRRAANGWREATVTWESKPKMVGGVLDDLGRIGSGRWVDLDVTRALEDNQVSFALVSTSADRAIFASREGARAPRLIVTVLRETT